MERTKATEVRKNWSAVCDSVVRKRPEFIRRVRDDLVLMSKDDLLSMLENYHYLARAYKEDDGSVTVSLDDIDIAENGETIESARKKRRIRSSSTRRSIMRIMHCIPMRRTENRISRSY